MDDVNVTHSTGHHYNNYSATNGLPGEYSARVLQALHVYGVPMLVACGLVGNVSCGLLLTTLDELRKRPLNVFLSSCCFSDSFFLFGLLCTWLSPGGPLTHGNQWCYLVSMLTNCSSLLSTWCVVGLLLYCYLDTAATAVSSISRPRTCSLLIAKMVVVGIAIAAVAIYVNLTLTLYSPNVGLCVPLAPYLPVIQVIYKIDLLFNTVLPFIACLVLVVTLLCPAPCRSCAAPPQPPTATNPQAALTATTENVTSTKTPLLRVNLPQPRSSSSSCSTSTAAAAEALSSARSMGWLFSVLLLSVAPNHTLRVIHAVREMIGAQHVITPSEFVAQSLVQYPLYTSYAIKGYLLLLLWTTYRRAVVRLGRRTLVVIARRLKCEKQRRSGDALNLVLRQHAQVTLLGHPQASVVEAGNQKVTAV